MLQKPKHVRFDGIDSDEEVLYMFRRSFLTNVSWMLLTLIILITPFVAAQIIIFGNSNFFDNFSAPFLIICLAFWYTFAFGFAFQNFLNWYYNLYIISNKRLVDIDFVGFLFKDISETPLSNIEDVTSTVGGALRVIFNVGTVTIQTAGAEREFDFTDVKDPSKVRDIISDIVAEINQPKKAKGKKR